MGLLGDINEFKKSFKNLSLLSKFICIIFFFISISSITSLSETIFGWKGFIKDGLDLYRLWYVKPISDILISFNLITDNYTIDKTTICFFFGLPTIIIFTKEQYLAVIWRFKHNQNNELHELKNFSGFIFKSIIFLWLILKIATLLFLTYLILASEYSIIITFNFYFLFWLIQLLDKKKSEKHKKYFYLLLIPLATILFMLILAAINKGITMK